MMKTKILSVGTSVPDVSYTQDQMVQILGIKETKALRFFQHDHIKSRNLIFPTAQNTDAKIKEETPGELREKFLSNSLKLMEKAVNEALKNSRLQKSDIDYIVCVTSTGFVVPGLSALFIEHMNLKSDCQRVDIVGMGCNAGLNGLNTVASWSQCHPDKVALLICCELCSCIYTLDDQENTSLVNSLFGDGVAAAIVKTDDRENENYPSLVKFHSHLIPGTLPHLRFNFDTEKNRYSFHVDKKTPEALANAIEVPFSKILKDCVVTKDQLKHWILHTGGDAILNGIQKKLELSSGDIRHTRSVLKDHGNVSSGSFLFSYQRLLNENKINKGDFGIMMTMGPGLTIEMCLLRW